MRSPTWSIRVGDVLDQLAEMPDGVVQCVVTSPPYWGLRDYGVEGMIGLEPTLQEHLAKLVEVFGEVRRVLRDDGTLWLNYGDAYAGSAKGGHVGKSTLEGSRNSQLEFRAAGRARDARKTAVETDANKARAKDRGYNVGSWGASDGAAEGFDRFHGSTDLAAKQRILMPACVALALQDSGWWVRSEIVWAKGVSFCPTYAGSCMPSSVTDRPTDSHEMVYLLTKAPRYFYDADAVREAGSENSHPRMKPGSEPPAQRRDRLVANGTWAMAEVASRNLRTVWTINPHGYKEAHFATFPEALVRPCVMAGTSERGACSECGAPWRRVVKEQPNAHPGSSHDHSADLVGHGAHRRNDGKPAGTVMRERHQAGRGRTTTGWEPTCDHTNAPARPCVVLDPFSGSGTTGAVSLGLGRSYVGIELNPGYAAMSRKRIGLAAEAQGLEVSPADLGRPAQRGLFGA